MTVRIKTPSHLNKLHVLVVDSGQRTLSLMVSVLRSLGFRNVYEAQDGFQATKMLQKREMDLIITDCDLQPNSMPYSLPPNPILRSEQWTPVRPEDGASFVQYLRQSKYSPNPYISIVMLTGLGLQNYIEYARDSGVNEILLKPLSVESLCQRIELIIDHPRPFIIAENYKGPCRRTDNKRRAGMPERRTHDIKIYRYSA